MKIEFDPNKSERNMLLRNLPFEKASEFDWENAIFIEDVRRDYSELRLVAYSYLGERLHAICFTPIENGVRIISFRKANVREVKKYEKETQLPPAVNDKIW